MKLTLTIVAFTAIFCFNSAFSQSACDTNECVRYAPDGTYKVISDTEASEFVQNTGNTAYQLTCEILCTIEWKRKPDENIIIQVGTYSILVYAGNIISKD